jgi:glycosyltransferase involved in cell wall biosynthesis
MTIKTSQSQPDTKVSNHSNVKKARVCMFVYNNFTNDSRVEKEAETLIQAGFDVIVLALLDTKTVTKEIRKGIEIIRIATNPWHLRVLRWIQGLGRAEQRSEVYGQKKSGKGFKSYVLKIFLQGVSICDALFTSLTMRFRETLRGPFKYLLLTIFYIFLVIGTVRLLYATELYSFFGQYELFIYIVLVLLIIFRKFVYLLLKIAQRIFSKALKNCLMPFHRHFCFLSFYRHAYSATAGQGFAVCHAHDLNTLPVAWLVARRDKAKLVYDSHELYIERNKLKPSSRLWKFIQRRMEGFLVRRCDAVFTVNESLADELAKRYKIPRPGVVMNTPARFEKADLHFLGNSRLRSELSVPREKNLLLYVGGITFNRGLEELIQSLSHLPDCYLVYMGYGNHAYMQSLVELAEKTGVRDRFAFFGPVPSDQVIHYAAGADVGVAPIANACLSYYYCSPNKLFEYMNAGLPIMASNFPELEKVVLGHEIGLTFDPADPLDIARTARQILDNPDTAQKMRGNSLKASEFYNWSHEAIKLIDIYQRIS